MGNGSPGHDDAPRRGSAIGSHDMLGWRSTQVKREEKMGTRWGETISFRAGRGSV